MSLVTAGTRRFCGLAQDARKGRRSYASWTSGRDVGRVSSSHCCPSKVAASRESFACDTPSRPGSRSHHSNVSPATAALYPLPFLRYSPISTASVCSGGRRIANSTSAPLLSFPEQQVQQHTQRALEGERCSQLPSWKVPGARTARRRARSSCCSLSVISETHERQWPLVTSAHRRPQKLRRKACCKGLPRSEQSWDWTAPTSHCRAAFPPSCSCPLDNFREACADSLVSHTEKLEARRLTFSMSPPPCTRATGTEAAAANSAAAEKSASAQTAAPGCSTTPPAAATETPSATATVENECAVQMVWARVGKMAGGGDACGWSVDTTTEIAASAAHGPVVQPHSRENAREAGLAPASLACTETNSSSVSVSRSGHGSWNTSSTYPLSRGFFITLRSFNSKSRRSNISTPNQRTADGTQADFNGATSVRTVRSNHPRVDTFMTCGTNSLRSSCHRTTESFQVGGGAASREWLLTTNVPQPGCTYTSDASVSSAPTEAVSPQAIHRFVEGRNAYAGAPAAAVAPLVNPTTVPPPALPDRYNPELSLFEVAAATSASKAADHLRNNRYDTAAAETSNEREIIVSTRSHSDQKCASTSVTCVPVHTEGDFAVTVPPAEAHDEDEPTPPVRPKAEMREAALFAFAKEYHGSLPSVYELEAVEEHVRHRQNEQWSFSFIEEKALIHVEQEQIQRQPQEKQLRRSPPMGQCSSGREYDFSGSSVLKVHESEGETDDSENGTNCRQEEALHLSYLKLTKARIRENIRCTLSR